jgi:hypothetical protein
MSASPIGCQIILLDDAGQAFQCLPDTFPDSTALVIGDYGYVYDRTEQDDDGQQVRYFKRTREQAKQD